MDSRLNPRAETGLKYGTERTIGSGEVWVPLDQGPDRVLYGDLRLMGDDDDNTEGNLGIGYRQLVSVPGTGHQAIAGVHGWIDRRHTDHDNNFHQATIGAELLGYDLDARVNAYLPLNDEKSYRTPNLGNATPYLAGSGILYDTTGTAIEEPQPGIDLELGWRLPILEQHTEAIRLYGGGYHFEGDQTDDVTGWRTRLVADVTPAVSVGGRFQRDDERGSQGFLEATIRFPFNAKKSFRAEGLRARLDESPERDVDIVSGSKITDTGLAKPVLSAATGEQQRVLHVDNTASSGGDGSKEQPFHQLKLAEAALQANDVIYVHHGDGTTTGQDLGIVIDKPNVSLIGSGADFIFDNDKFTTGNGASLIGVIIARSTIAPVITNTIANANPTTDNITGTAIVISGANSYLSGLSLEDAEANGIYAVANNSSFGDLTIRHIISDGALQRGLFIHALNGGTIDSITISNSSFNDSSDPLLGRGIDIVSEGMNSRIDQVSASKNYTENNSYWGAAIIARSSGSIGDVEIKNHNSHSNSYQGIVVSAQTGGYIDSAKLSGNKTGNSIIFSPSSVGIQVAANGSGSYIARSILEENESFNNANGGISLSASNSGEIRDIILTRNSFYSNTGTGVVVTATSAGSIDKAVIQNNIITSSSQNGIFINDDTSGSINIDLGNGAFGGTGRNSIYGNGTSNPSAYRDMRLDLDGSLTPLPAQGNWWGQPGGPTAGQVISEGAGSPPAANTGSADTSNALGSDPNL